MRIPSPEKISDFLQVTQIKIKSQILLIPNSVFLPPPYTSKILVSTTGIKFEPIKSPLLIEIPALITSNFPTFRLSVSLLWEFCTCSSNRNVSSKLSHWKYLHSFILPVVMYGCESWTTKKAERLRMDAFECGVGEDSRESLGLQGNQTSPS